MIKVFSTLSVFVLALLPAVVSGQGLIPPVSGRDKDRIETKLTVKDNDHEVIVRGNRFLVELPHRSRYEWKSLPAANSSDLTPKELMELRKYVTENSPNQNLGAGQMQVSTFEYPEVNQRKVKLELVYTDRPIPSEAPKNGELYKPEGPDLSKENNRPKPNMRFVVTLRRE